MSMTINRSTLIIRFSVGSNRPALTIYRMVDSVLIAFFESFITHKHCHHPIPLLLLPFFSKHCHTHTPSTTLTSLRLYYPHTHTYTYTHTHTHHSHPPTGGRKTRPHSKRPRESAPAGARRIFGHLPRGPRPSRPGARRSRRSHQGCSGASGQQRGHAGAIDEDYACERA